MRPPVIHAPDVPAVPGDGRDYRTGQPIDPTRTRGFVPTLHPGDNLFVFRAESDEPRTVFLRFDPPINFKVVMSALLTIGVQGAEQTYAYDVPRCGLALSVPAGYATVRVLLDKTSTVPSIDLHTSLAPGWPTASVIAQRVVLAALGLAHLVAPSWARGARVDVVQGAADLALGASGVVATTLAAPAHARIDVAPDWTVTAGAGGAVVVTTWDLYS